VQHDVTISFDDIGAMISASRFCVSVDSDVYTTEDVAQILREILAAIESGQITDLSE
jgi:hypothetical protein